MRKLVILAGLVMFLPLALRAQDEIPKADLYVGYSYLRMNKADFVGWNAAVAGNINKNLALVGDISGHYNSQNRNVAGIQTDSSSAVHSIFFGPRISDQAARWSPFVQALGGWSRLRTETTSTTATTTSSSESSRNGFGFVAGGGLDFHMTKSVNIRVIQVEYMMLRTNGVKNEGARVGGGLVFELGHKQQ